MPHLRVVKATLQAQEQATSSIPRKLLLVGAVAAVSFGLILVRAALGKQELDPEQRWFWTPEWLSGELAADQEIATRLGTQYDSDDAFLASLESRLDVE